MNRRARGLLIGLALAGLFLWLAVRDVEFDALRESLLDASLWPLVPIALFLTLFYWLKAWRWRALFPVSEQPSTIRLINPMMIGFAANNVLPFRAGELVRVILASRSLGQSKSLVLATLVLERVLDVLAIAVIVVAGVTYASISGLASSGLGSSLLVAAFAVVALTAVLALMPVVARVDGSFLTRRFPERFRESAHQSLVRFQNGLLVLANRRVFVTLVANSLVQWLLLTGCIGLSFIAVRGEPLSFSVAAVLLGIMVLGISLPSSPGFVGTIEYSFVFGLGLFGVVSTEALAMAVYYHVVTLGYVVIVGSICLLTIYLKRQSAAAR